MMGDYPRPDHFDAQNLARWADEGGTTVEMTPKPPDTAAVLKAVRGRTPRRVEIVECDAGFVLMLSRGDNTEYQIHTSAEAAAAHAEEFLCDD